MYYPELGEEVCFQYVKKFRGVVIEPLVNESQCRIKVSQSTRDDFDVEETTLVYLSDIVPVNPKPKYKSHKLTKIFK